MRGDELSEDSDLSVAAVVLAAGRGARIGERPKCLLELNNEPLIRLQIRALSAAGISTIVVVLGHYGPRVAAAIDSSKNCPAVTYVMQASKEHSQPGSIRLGLAALPTTVEAVLVCPSDLPLLTVEDYQDVMRAFVHKPDNKGFVGPVVDNIPGNPVMFDKGVMTDILAGHGQFGCGNWRSQQPASVFHWATSNRRYITDIDSEDDRIRLARDSGVELHWPEEFA